MAQGLPLSGFQTVFGKEVTGWAVQEAETYEKQQLEEEKKWNGPYSDIEMKRVDSKKNF